MDIFSHLDERILYAADEEAQVLGEFDAAQKRHWEAYDTQEDVEYAERVERRAMNRAQLYIDRTERLRSLQVLAAVKDIDIDTLKAEFTAILEAAYTSEDRSLFNDAFALWALTIDENFTFLGWADAKGTQGEYPKFGYHFPRGKHTDEMVHNLNIMARTIRRPYDYMVDFETTKENVKGSGILTFTGDYMEHAAVNHKLLRWKRPQAFGSVVTAVEKASYHHSDRHYKGH